MKENKIIFISYSSQDKKFVSKLANDLLGHKIQVWWDSWEMKVGDSIGKK